MFDEILHCDWHDFSQIRNVYQTKISISGIKAQNDDFEKRVFNGFGFHNFFCRRALYG